MPKPTGEEFPERELMAVISDLLGIEHFTTAKGSSVRRDFLEAMALGLGLTDASKQTFAKKEDLLAACYKVAVGDSIPSEKLSTGGTVTNAALQDIADGLIRMRGASTDREQSPDGTDHQGFDPTSIEDLRDRRLIESVIRQGGDGFRSKVLKAYKSRCAITQADAVEALEAAHITPYMGPATNTIDNGICLRADLHRLWDRGGIAIHETSGRVLIRYSLLATTYRDLAKTTAKLPRSLHQRPSISSLRAHREWCGL